MKETGRFWLAAALAPLSVPALTALMSLFSGPGFVMQSIAYVVPVTAVSYIGFLVFGLPFVLVLKFTGKLTFLALLIGGVVAGPLFLIFMQVWAEDPVTFQAPYAQAAVSFSVLTVLVAMVFGLIARVKVR